MGMGVIVGSMGGAFAVDPEKEVRSKRSFDKPIFENTVFAFVFAFLDMAHTNRVSSIRKTAYQPWI